MDIIPKYKNKKCCLDIGKMETSLTHCGKVIMCFSISSMALSLEILYKTKAKRSYDSAVSLLVISEGTENNPQDRYIQMGRVVHTFGSQRGGSL